MQRVDRNVDSFRLIYHQTPALDGGLGLGIDRGQRALMAVNTRGPCAMRPQGVIGFALQVSNTLSRQLTVRGRHWDLHVPQ